MFPLLRNFAIASAVLLLLTASLVVTLYRQTSLHHMVSHGEDTSVIIARSVRSSLWPQYGWFLAPDTTTPADRSWVTQPSQAQLRSLIEQQTAGLSIHVITIYDARGTRTFSTLDAPSEQDVAASPAVLAALAGETTSVLDSLDIQNPGRRKSERLDILSTTVPILDRHGEVEAVIEVHADASKVMHHLFRNTVFCALVLLLVFAALYIALLLTVRHASRTVTAHHRENLAAKEELAGKNQALADEVYERKRAELALRELNQDLETLIAERTAALHETQEDLLRKQRLASLGQLIGTVGHDLRNPLGVIHNSLAVIRERSKQAGLDLERQLERSERSLGRCDGIIRDLLDNTRIQEIARKATDIDTWILQVLNEQPLPEGIGLKCDLTASGMEVLLDVERFRRVVINIIDNACQAMAERPGGGECQLTVATRVKGGRVEISFRDTGPGIEAALMSKIFEPLFTTKQQGVGLGLPMVKQVVELHGGVIDVTSEAGQGTCITLCMPTRGAAEAAA